MKKVTLLLLTFLSLFLLVSCGEGIRFNSEEEMLAHLEGIWRIDDSDSYDYYVFRNGQVYKTSSETLEYEFEELLNTTLEKDGVAGWKELDFQTAIQKIRVEDLIRSPLSNVYTNPKKGFLRIDKGQSYEKRITITDDAVLIRGVETRSYDQTLVKISDTVDFSAKRFEEIFIQAKKSFRVSASTLWKSTDEFASELKKMHPEINSWLPVGNDESTKIYTTNGKTSGFTGSLTITEKSVIFTKKENNYSNDSFNLIYMPGNSSGNDLAIANNMGSIGLKQLLDYVAIATENFPGDYDAATLYNQYYADRTVYDGNGYTASYYSYKTTSGPLEYLIAQSFSTKGATITVSASGTVLLSGSN